MDQFRCQVCPAIFTAKQNLTRYFRENHRGAVIRVKFRFDDCRATLPRKGNLPQDLREKDTDNVPAFLCKKCGLGFSRRTVFNKN
ncbi:hypothetical protein PoB_003857200 [Plakobranchus ocellatus]|uniref:C2H2-type domain-containing protein n=1 Tax=Plakobranchus ocellatus TaxID=259542 RepID=A0AAV4AXQ7_9GAST|nr:hypothetical protein PoB_003857200 [Plakobranchus ocellatus]